MKKNTATIAQKFITSLEPKLCVISTVNPGGKPQSAIVAYAVASELSIIISTHQDTRKWNNISKNNNVSLVFGTDFGGYNVQYDGKARLIMDDDETEEIFYASNPSLVKFKDMPGKAFIRVLPCWIRVSDYSVSPPDVQEKQFRF